MTLIARGAGSGDIVTCVDHGKPRGQPNPCGCCEPLVAELTNQMSPNVFVHGVGVVRLGDTMVSHPKAFPRNQNDPPCTPHEPPCNSASPNVFANGKGVARLLDTYWETNNHIISSINQSDVFANGE